MYKHMVIFALKSGKVSEETKSFLLDGERIITAIPNVKNFQVLHQVSKKNDFDFCFFMEFDSASDFESYLIHPDHVAFVNERWDTEVARFMEIDLE